MIPILACRCGRTWAHCYNCEARGVYVRTRESEWLSKRLKQKVTCFKCKSCGFEFDSSMECPLSETSNMSVIVRSEETNLEFANRLKKEGKTTEEIIAILADKNIPVTVDQPIQPTKTEEELPEGWTKDSEGRIESPVSIEDILAKNHSEKKG